MTYRMFDAVKQKALAMHLVSHMIMYEKKKREFSVYAGVMFRASGLRLLSSIVHTIHNTSTFQTVRVFEARPHGFCIVRMCAAHKIKS